VRRAVDEGHVDLRRLTPERVKVLHAIMRCRTAEMGGHAVVCSDCEHVNIAYNSCRNRHCPQCQWSAQEKWIARRESRLLDTHYSHVVFTLPGELRPLAMYNSKQLYTLLFRASSRTLLELGRNPKHLGADLGVTSVLHTWTRELHYHPHVHCLVTGGGLSVDGSSWVSTRSRTFLFPVKVMGRLFRGKFLAGLKALYRRGEIVGIDEPDFYRLVDSLYATDWNIYSKPTMLGPEQVIAYLGRYTHRVGISSSRIRRIGSETVTFVTRKKNTTTIPLAEFVRLLSLHVLPDRFMKIRHYGIYASANIKTKWARANELRPVTLDKQDEQHEPPGSCCDACGSTNVIRVALSRNQTLVVTEHGIDLVQLPSARGPPRSKHPGGTL